MHTLTTWLFYHSSSELHTLITSNFSYSSCEARTLGCLLTPLSLIFWITFLFVATWRILYHLSSELRILTTSIFSHSTFELHTLCYHLTYPLFHLLNCRLLPLQSHLSSVMHSHYCHLTFPLSLILWTALSVVTWPTLYHHSSSEIPTSVATWPLDLSLGVSSAFSSYSRISVIYLLSIGLPSYQWCSTSITYNVWTKCSVAKNSSILDAPPGSSQNLKGNRILKLVMKRKRWLLGVEVSCILLLFQGSLWSV